MNASTLRKLVIPAVIVGVLLIVVAIVYFVTPEQSLPSFFPGHASASSAEANHHHTKHGIAALIVALALLRVRLVPDRTQNAHRWSGSRGLTRDPRPAATRPNHGAAGANPETRRRARPSASTRLRTRIRAC